MAGVASAGLGNGRCPGWVAAADNSRQRERTQRENVGVERHRANGVISRLHRGSDETPWPIRLAGYRRLPTESSCSNRPARHPAVEGTVMTTNPNATISKLSDSGRSITPADDIRGLTV